MAYIPGYQSVLTSSINKTSLYVNIIANSSLFHILGNMALLATLLEKLQRWKAYYNFYVWGSYGLFPRIMTRCQWSGGDAFSVIRRWSAVCFKDSFFSVSFQLDLIRVLPAPVAMEAPVRKREGATDVCVLTDLLENTAKWVSTTLMLYF